MKGIDIARKYIGFDVRKDNQKLKDFFKSKSINGDIDIDPSKTPWCAAFINACERQIGNIGTGLLNAKSFLDYGQRVEYKDAKEGDIAIFHFPGESNEHGHVTYVTGIHLLEVSCIGGNQRHGVNLTVYPIQYLIGLRRS